MSLNWVGYKPGGKHTAHETTLKAQFGPQTKINVAALG